VLPQNHEGFDIESRTSDGTLARFIEVKALSGEWGVTGAGLSKPQFDKAVELGDQYWLYVVERAEQNDYRIYRIQNPARQVNQFIYDSGWRGLAEERSN
jgi:hypothetical protein